MTSKQHLKVQSITELVNAIQNSKKRYIALEGGSSSGKTWSIVQWLFFGYCMQNTGKRISMFKERLVWFKQTVLKDIYSVLGAYDLYDPNNHNKSDQEFYWNGNEMWYSGTNERKFHGRRQDLAWINEALDEGICLLRPSA